ncbi:MFS transporter [Streptomyces cylindrosporus]|uniref:MFS transporter n=1 Tax=Streptomyces cylindrosporus TaxID=2927583 RepID=A0ABS9YL13_9ACTN|nr:MFS transporter [Streptomyces cylindrosporus]MCI3277963.1 MFS transporter [Streptomyces cylindrosporus]
MWILVAVGGLVLSARRSLRRSGTVRAPREAAGHRQAGGQPAVAVLLLAAFGVAACQTIVLAALPVLARDFEVTTPSATWLLTAFMLASAVATPIAGRLGDQYGHRTVLAAGLGCLAAGSALAAVGADAGWFAGALAGRAVQGLSGGVFPAAFGLARATVPPERLGRVVAGLSAMFGVGGAVGMVAAGPVVGVAAPAWLFLGCLAVALLALAGTARLPAPGARGDRARIDVPGALLLTAAVAGLLLTISQGRLWGWSSAAILLTASVTLVSAVAFVVTETRTREPLVDLRVLAGRRLAPVSIATLVVSVGMFAAVTLLPALAQTPSAAGYGFGYSAARTALLIAPIAAFMVLAAPLAARLTSTVGARRVFQSGAALGSVSLLALALAHDHPWQLASAGAVLGIAYGLAFASVGNLVVGAVDAGRTGVATGMNTILRTIGGALGAQIAAAIVAGATPAHAAVPSESGYRAAFLVAAVIVFLALPAVAELPRRAEPTRT